MKTYHAVIDGSRRIWLTMNYDTLQACIDACKILFKTGDTFGKIFAADIYDNDSNFIRPVTKNN
jgi:hypothetical protein